MEEYLIMNLQKTILEWKYHSLNMSQVKYNQEISQKVQEFSALLQKI